ncbi:MAG TPA: hypothetical protein DD435_15220 [Cyanobacteria bacterium UBA8530]|nr:hypothetical protein [Cyanobacteria bacterium UBA8530]
MSLVSKLQRIPVFSRLGHEFSEGAKAASKIVAPFGIYRNPLAPPPPKRDSLRIMSYNVLNGGQDYLSIKTNIAKGGADVVGLQEISRENAEKLAHELNMHLAYFDRPDVAGKAILSRYPIKSGGHVDYPVSMGDRLSLYLKKVLNGEKKSFECLEARGMLVSNIEASGRKITLIDTHLTLGVVDFNAKQLAFLDDFAEKQRAKGYEVVITGDFNTNFNIQKVSGGANSAEFEDQTDSVEEYRKRYEKNAGNAQDASDRAALRKLQQDFNPFWEAKDKSVIDKEGKKMTPDQARAELKKVSKGSDRFDELVDIADGNSHVKADKRFDNILSSLKVKESWIDLSAKGSDHQPVFTELDLR